MRSITIVVALLTLFSTTAQVTQVATNYEGLRQQAEAQYNEKSFSRAHELYERASRLTLTKDEQRWVAFRLADTSWRAIAANPGADTSAREEAQRGLEAVIRETGDDHDRIWAEVNESLGDLHFAPNGYPDIGSSWPFYNAALDWWGGSDDLKLARSRYLAIVFRIADAEEGRYGSTNVMYAVPETVLANAVAIAESAGDRTRAQYLHGMQQLRTGQARNVERGLELLEQVIAQGKASAWYDDALFAAAQRLAAGKVVVLDDGQVTFRPDFTKALEYYRRIVNEFTAGQSRYVPQATSEIRNITQPSVTAMVAGTFLPRSEQEVIVSWRNVKDIELSIIPVKISSQFEPSLGGGWFDKIRTDGVKSARKIIVHTTDTGDHVPGNEHVRISPKLDRGAYIALVTGAGITSRQLILVTDLNVTAHTLGGRSDIMVTRATTGEPVPNAKVRVWHQLQAGGFVTRDGVSGKDGMVSLSMTDKPVGGTLFMTADTADNDQAYLQTWAYNYGRDANEWRIYAYTDRPAYRPGETVHWKFVARARKDDIWRTPAGETFAYEVTGPRGEKVSSGKATLNSFGSFWADIPLDSSMSLGVYNIQFRRDDVGPNHYVGGAQLFRMEEYKLPEFKVAVTTTGASGETRLYRLGDRVEASIEATYYFGGPVANATVQARISRRPHYRHWDGWREYSWYWQDTKRGSGSFIREETLKTDAQGRAVVQIETSPDDGDSVYTIEASVTDSSRREVSGSGSVTVLRQSYSVTAHPDSYIRKPGDRLTVDFKAVDANDKPVQTTGTVTVVRRQWQEVWINDAGKEITGRELERARATWPEGGLPEWRQKIATYKEETVLTTKVSTDASGEGKLVIDAPREGYYAIRWSSEDRDAKSPRRARDLVTTETTVYVSDSSSFDIGYRSGNLDIIVEKDAFRSGNTATAMIVTPASGRWVLLTSTSTRILDSQVLHLDGTVKLVQIALDDRHVPSFHLTASSVFDRILSNVSKQIIVPPVEHFLDVDVKTDRESYEPRTDGTVTVITRDVDGKPVPAEVSLSVSDQAVTAIQGDLAGDPRKHFFGELSSQPAQSVASVQTQRYVVFVETKDGLVEEREQLRRKRLGKDQKKNEEGDGKSGALNMAPPPPMAAMVGGVSEAITVAASSPMIQDAAQEISLQRQDKASNSIEVTVRSDFSSTAFWQPDVITGTDGTARVKVKYPDALTTWVLNARAFSAKTQVGMGTSTTKTNMPLIVRLQAPRFFVEGDRVTISAVINNNTDRAMRVTPSIEASGVTLDGSATATPIDVPANGEARANWIVRAQNPGEAKLRVTARNAERGDAMEKTFTVYEHGVDKLVARSGKLRGDEAIVQLDLPHDRRATSVAVQVQPSIAVTMLDALPYLIDFPYGCVEQTMSRFLPAAIVAQALTKNGIDPDAIEGRIFGGIEQQYAKKTHTTTPKNLGLLSKTTKASMARLYDFQHSDGGWGWWKQGESDHFMTAYVVWGFAVAKEGGLAVNDEAVRRAIAYLDLKLVEHERDLNGRIWILHAIASWRAAANDRGFTKNQQVAFDEAFAARDRVTAYSRALLALAAHAFGSNERAAVLIRNLEDGVKIDRAPDKSILLRGSGSNAAEVMGTAHWGEDRGWWRWHDGAVESTAFALRALVRIDPTNKLIEPAMNWLVKNRRGAQWNNTRDTAIAVLALSDYLRVSGELKGDVAYEVSVNGKVIGTRTITRATLLGAPSRFDVDAALVRDANEIRIRRTSGSAPLYFSAEGRFFSLEEPVKAAGNEIFVRRDYFRMAPKPTLLKGVVYERVPLRDQGTIKSGERVEVVVTIETKNDYDYLLFEDLKPAGIEAVGLQSGSPLYATELRAPTVTRKFAAGDPPGEKPTVVQRARSADTTYRNAWVYQELRDRKVALFIDHLPQGTWEIRYTMRAEVPGTFHALPILGQAMYVPEIRANGEEVRVTVSE